MHTQFLTRVIWPALAALAALPGFAQDEELLRPEEAFRYAASDTGSAIEVDWALADGYYLYRRKLSFSSSSPNVVLGEAELPEGLHHEDEFFGVQQVYRERFFVSIPYEIRGDRPASIELTIKSQGCADIGICYPPQTWTETVPLVAARGNLPKLSLGGLGGSEFLPVDEAFRPLLTAIDGNTVEVAFQITPGYYLYRDKLTVATASGRVQLGRLDLPAGELKVDEWFGEMEVYHNDVFARLPLARAAPEPIRLDLTLGYQGCADGGLCYPPQLREMSVELPAATAVSALPARPSAAPVTEQARLAALIGESSLWVVVATFFGAGLLLAFTPCVLPMVPILSGIIAGEGDDVSSGRGFGLALSYVMGMALVYTAAGIGAAAVGVQLQAVFNAPWVLILFSGLFVLLALGMFGLYDLQMPSGVQSRLAAISGRQKSGTVIGAFVMGALSSLIVTACVAPPLVATLTVIGQAGDVLRGGTALFALSLGMGAPLLLVGASAGKLLPKAGAWMVAVKNAFGFMMLGLAVWMLSRILPGEATLALWGVLTFMAGIFLGALTPLSPEAGGVRKLGKGFGVLAMVWGVAMLLGAMAGAHNPLQPLAGIGPAERAAAVESHGLEFRRIKTVSDLDDALARAAAEGKTAMLDFYADWCVSCKEMEAYTFPDPAVRQALANTVLLQADVTANDAADQALLNRFGVFGPPTIIFFGPDGRQIEGYEVVGYMKAADFVAHIELTFASGTVSARVLP
ncbi:MAG: protein-disulfide reductase DsbD [Gammaproteobacteria bacterium]|nr:protein-disulfide reductase DsbD [Gammaproteobacteria bacterium]MDH4253082.1 protein-disulfide reductase DsbD [Gammaproteobacteria bacterium]MDH5308908.1 protein-disulfide reductase DsbD [Gammaproteobacteria bacterium]